MNKIAQKDDFARIVIKYCFDMFYLDSNNQDEIRAMEFLVYKEAQGPIGSGVVRKHW